MQEGEEGAGEDAADYATFEAYVQRQRKTLGKKANGQKGEDARNKGIAGVSGGKKGEKTDDEAVIEVGRSEKLGAEGSR